MNPFREASRREFVAKQMQSVLERFSIIVLYWNEDGRPSSDDDMIVDLASRATALVNFIKNGGDVPYGGRH